MEINPNATEVADLFGVSKEFITDSMFNISDIKSPLYLGLISNEQFLALVIELGNNENERVFLSYSAAMIITNIKCSEEYEYKIQQLQTVSMN